MLKVQNAATAATAEKSLSPPMSRSTSLLDKSLRAAGWGYVGSVVRLFVQIIAQIVLARLLGPQDYGLFAIGVVLVSLTFLFSDVASSALIPMAEVNQGQLGFAFFCQLLAGALATFILIAFAQPIAILMGQARSEAVIMALAPVCLINAIGGVALAQLRRRLAYGSIQFAQTLGYFLGYILVAIPLAVWFDAGVWALVAAWLVQASLTSLVYWLKAPHSLIPVTTCDESRQMLDFGLAAMLANFSNWALANVDKLIVARFSPLIETGLYSTSMSLLNTPLAQILGTFQSVTFSASSRMEKGADEKLFLPLVGLVSLVIWSMYGFVFAVSETLISALYGPKWIAAVPYMSAFSVSLAAFGTMSAITPLLWGRGAVRREALPQFWMALLLALVAWFAVKQSSLAVAWGVAAVYILRCGWIIASGVQTFKVSGVALLVMSTRVGSFAVLLSVLSLLLDRELMHYLRHPLPRLLCDSLFLFVILTLGLIFRRVWFGALLAAIIDQPINALLKRLRLK
jgi:lipopolysaccharide exporter